MRIALLNNRFFMVGGTTRYLFNVKSLLEQAGHLVVPFSNRYPQTVASPYEKYFVAPPGDPDAPFYGQAKLSMRRKLDLFVRGTYSTSVKTSFGSLLDAERIDLAFSINICNFLGPSVIDAAKDRGLPFVMRLSDFNLLCPAYNFTREGRPCEECSSNLLKAVQHRCLQDSVAVSAARVLAMMVHRWRGVYGRVDGMITPTSFLRSKLMENGFGAGVVTHVPTFVDLSAFSPTNDEPRPELIYLGRLSAEKGTDIVIDAMARLPASSRLKLVLLGDGDPGFVSTLVQHADRAAPGRVEFAGFVEHDELVRRVSRATAVVHPARCYENMPNAITEAMALARPVLASDLGSLPEQVEDGETGWLLDPEDPAAWADAAARLEKDHGLRRRFGDAGRAKAERDYTPEKHYERLMNVFRRAGAPVASEDSPG